MGWVSCDYITGSNFKRTEQHLQSKSKHAFSSVHALFNSCHLTLSTRFFNMCKPWPAIKSMQRDAKVTRACRCVFTQCRNKVVVVVDVPISSYTHWSLRGISDCEVQVNVLRGLSVWLALSYVRRRRKGHGSEWLEADMGFNESSASYSRVGERRQRKGHGALCGRHEHWLPSPHLPQTHTLFSLCLVYVGVELGLGRFVQRNTCLDQREFTKWIKKYTE